MITAISIYEAKTHLSRYVQQAKAGKSIYIGSYGKPEVMLVPAKSQKRPIKIGLWKSRAIGYRDEDIIGPDLDIAKDFEDSINQPMP